MSAAYFWTLHAEEVHLHERGSTMPPMKVFDQMTRQHGRGVLYWYNGKSWLQVHPHTMRMEIEPEMVPVQVRALHLVHT